MFKQDWFSTPQWWFNCSTEDDTLICRKYEHLLAEPYPDDPLEQILIFDQLPRHVFRNQCSNHIITYFLNKALEILNNTDKTYINSLNDNEWCFMMLPYRHSQQPQLIVNVIEDSWKRLVINKSLILKRYLKATYERMPKNDQSHYIQYYEPSSNNDIDIYNAYAHVIDDKNHDVALGATITPIIDNVPVILSLSGGVDSMVCSEICKSIVAAVHINYKNRATCDEEESFVKAWCSLKSIPLYVRRINEIQRKPCMENDMREIYEKYTRDVRFNTYKTVASILEIKPIVVLGHNKDDCLENIFTNIAHNNHYENLLGMSTKSWQDDICFIRPLLNTSKNDILSCAKNMRIPHLPNSTPAWSQRGQIRNSIVPVVEKWDIRFIEGLFNITKSMSALYGFLSNTCELYVKKFRDNECVTVAQGELPTDMLFWREVITKVATRPKDKSLRNLQDRIIYFTKHEDIKKANVVINSKIGLKLERHICGKIDITLVRKSKDDLHC